MAISTDLHARFCRRLRDKRNELGLTQSQLADKLGIRQPSVAQLESGEYVPSLDTVDTVCRALGIDPGCLLSADSVSV
jgi:transcriptional regulator with XRE-family HTH domain